MSPPPDTSAPNVSVADSTAGSGAAPTPAARTRHGGHTVRWTALAVLVVVLVVGVVFGLRLANGPAPIRSAIIGEAAPSFDLPGLRGGRVRSADYAGQMYVVNFWASWCVPCREEAPRLEAFARRWQGRVQVIGIDWQDAPGAANDFVDEFHLTYPEAVDVDSRLAIRYGVRGVPETYVVTSTGVVGAGVIGAVGPHTLDDLVEEVIAGHQGAFRGGGYRTNNP